MPGAIGRSGGKRPGAGRKPGKAKVSPAIRAVARANVVEILQNRRDPLMSLLDLADDPETPIDQRIKAYGQALPYVRPRLSMSVSADVTPKPGAEQVDQQVLLGKMMAALDRLAGSNKPIPVTIEAKADRGDE